MSALNNQVGGSHYKDCAIQPIEYIQGNRLGFIEGNIVKYITRWREKGGIQDLEKIRHYVDLLIELETKDDKQPCLPGMESHIAPGGIHYYLPKKPVEQVDFYMLSKDVYPATEFRGFVVTDNGHHAGFNDYVGCLNVINDNADADLTILAVNAPELLRLLWGRQSPDNVCLLNWGHNGFQALRYQRPKKDVKDSEGKN